MESNRKVFYLSALACTVFPSLVLGAYWGGIGFAVGATWGVISAFAGGESAGEIGALILIPAWFTGVSIPIFLGLVIVVAILASVSRQRLLETL